MGGLSPQWLGRPRDDVARQYAASAEPTVSDRLESAGDVIVADLPRWNQRLGLGLSVLAILFFVLDAAGKLLQVEPVLEGTADLGWPVSAVVPLGVLLLAGTILYAIPRTAVIGAIYLTGFLGGAIATHYRIGSPLLTHVLFGVYVAAIMWSGLALRFPGVLSAVFSPTQIRSR
jgi:hypothetical protein